MPERKRIIIVDNDIICRMMLRGILKDEYDIEEADSSEALLENMRSDAKGYDIVLLDIFLPGIDGFKALEEIKNDSKLSSTPVVIISAYGEPDNEIKALRLGAEDFIAKPFEPLVIKQRLSNIIVRYEIDTIKKIRDSVKAQEEHQRLLEDLFNSIDCGIVLFEKEDDVVTALYVNDPTSSLVGYERAELIEHLNKNKVLSLTHPADRRKMQIGLDKIMREKGTFSEISRIRRKDGEYVWMKVSLHIFEQNGAKTTFIGTYVDMNSAIHDRDMLRFYVEYDLLTGIYNKETFYRKTAEFIRDNPDDKHILIRWDIENLKLINDLFGWNIGNEILKEIGNKFKKGIRGYGTYGRLDNDHFATCLPAKYFEINTFNEIVSKCFSDFNLPHKIIINIGIFEINDPELSVDQMCDRAGLAIQTIKGNYNIHYAFYDEKLRESLVYEQKIIDSMHEAIENKQFKVYLQPIYNINKEKMTSAEALVRWVHPERGIISPAEFIPIFEKNGFIAELDNYVWEETCGIIDKMKSKGFEPIPISVNASRRTLYDTTLCERAKRLVQKYNIEPEYFRIEITESAYVDNPEQLIDTVKRLKENGFQVLMDDFGSGYSSFSTLMEIPVDILKIDMRFLQGYENGGKTGTILTSILNMSKNLGIPVIAEGVEFGGQKEFLRSIGCSFVQGYIYAKPMPSEAFVAGLKEA